MNFPDMIRYMADIGVADVLFPFVLVFTVIFAIFQKVKIFGDAKEGKRFHVMIALVMAFAVVIPHVLNAYPPGADVVDIMNSALPNVSLVIVAILMFLLMIGIWGIEFMGGSISGWIAILALLVVGYIFASSAGWAPEVPNWLSFLEDPDTQALIVIILVFGLIVWLITKEPKKKEDKGKFDDSYFAKMLAKGFDKSKKGE